METVICVIVAFVATELVLNAIDKKKKEKNNSITVSKVIEKERGNE